MAETYKDFAREPSKPHQCMHNSEEDGTRCRAIAMHNQYMCYHHRSDDIPTVIENDPFLIAGLHDHDEIQQALTDVAARLACNRMDFKRAALLLQSLQIASSNLAAKARLIANLPEPAAVILSEAKNPSPDVILSEPKNPRIYTATNAEENTAIPASQANSTHSHVPATSAQTNIPEAPRRNRSRHPRHGAERASSAHLRVQDAAL